MLTLADGVAEAAKPPPIVVRGVHIDEAGAGWAGGVTGSPWWKVEVPYTPIGYRNVAGELTEANKHEAAVTGQVKNVEQSATGL